MNATVEEALAKARDIENKTHDLFGTVNDVLSWIPDFLSHLVEPIQQATNDLWRKVEEFWAKIKEFCDQPGDADKLRQVAVQWADAVAYPVSDISKNLALHKLKTHVEWEGRAAEVYESTLPAQVDGLGAMKDLGIQMRDSLNSLAGAIDHFWLTIKIIFIGILAALFTAVLEALFPPTIPVAIATVVATIAGGVTAILTTIDTINITMDTIVTAQNAISDRVRSLGDSWSRTDLRSMSDKGDWELE